MSYSDRKEGNWNYREVQARLKAQEKANKVAIKAAQKSGYASTPSNHSVDEVMADYNSWLSGQGEPKTADAVMAYYNAWNKSTYGAGNIDLHNRPKYRQPDGSISTVNSMSFNDNGKEVLIPTIAYDANGNPAQLSDDEAIKRYYDTGEYLGKFNTVEEANAYAEQLHKDQEAYYMGNDGKRTPVAQKGSPRPVSGQEEKRYDVPKRPEPSAVIPVLQRATNEAEGRAIQERERERLAQEERQAKNKAARLEKITGESAQVIAKDDKRIRQETKRGSEGSNKPFANYSDEELKIALAQSDPLLGSMSFRENQRQRALGNEITSRREQKERDALTKKRGENDLEYLQRVQSLVTPEDVAKAVAERRRASNVPDIEEAQWLANTPNFTSGAHRRAEEILSQYDSETIMRDPALKALYSRTFNDNAALAFMGGVNSQLANRYYAADQALTNATGGRNLAERTASLDPNSSYNYNRIMAANAEASGNPEEAALYQNAADNAAQAYDFGQMNEDSARDHGLAYGAGKIAGALGENVFLNGLLGEAGFLADTGNKALDFAANQGIQLIPDLISDTLPEVAEAYNEGERGWDLAGTAAKNIGLNALYNVATEAIPALRSAWKAANPADASAVVKNADDVAEASAKAVNPEEAIEQAQKQADNAVEASPIAKEAIEDGAKTNNVIPEDLADGDIKTSKLRTNTAEKSGILNGHEAEFPEADYAYRELSEEAQHEGVKVRYGSSQNLVSDLMAKENYDAIDVKASMDEWKRLLEANDEESIQKAKALGRKIAYEGREDGRAVQAFAEYSRDPGTSGLKKAQTEMNKAVDKLYGDGTSEAVNNLAMKVDVALKDVDLNDRDAVVARLTELFEKDLKSYAPSNKAMQKTGNRAIKGKKSIIENVRAGKYANPEDIIDDIFKKNGVYNPSVADQQKVYQLLKEASKYADKSYKQEELLAQAAKIVTANMPSSLGDKFRSYLYTNMLGNFKTAVSRNAFGNFAFQALEQLRQPVAGALDWAASKLTKKRSATGWSLGKAKSYLSGLKKGATEQSLDVLKHISTGRSGELGWANALKNNKSTWGKKGIGKLAGEAEYFVTSAMKFGDRPFYEANYAQNLFELNSLLNKYGKEGVAGLAGVPDSQLADVMDMIASVRAADSVFQKQGMISSGLTKLRDGLSEMSRGYLGVDVLGTSATPFTMTPGNIIERAVEYSPLGILKNGIETASEVANGSFNQRRFIDELSRTATGAPLLYGGYKLAESGAINGGYSEDEDQRRAQYDDGYIPYGLNIDGTTFDTSDLPVIGPFMQTGSAIYENGLNPGSFMKASEAVLGSSATQGIRRAFGAESGGGYNSSDGVVDNLANTVGSAGTQLIPSLLRQTAQFTDPYKRDLGEYGTPEYYLNGIINSIPGARQTLPVKADSEGYIVEQNQGREGLEKFLENYVYPMNVSEYTPSELNQEAVRLQNETSDQTNKAFIPQAKRNDIREELEKAEIEYSEELYRKYKNKLGKTGRELGTAVMNSEWYKGLDPDTQAQAMADAYSVAKQMAFNKVAGKEITNKLARVYDDYGTEGMIAYMQVRNGVDGSQKNYAKINALSELSPELQEEMLPEFMELEKEDGSPNTNGEFVEKYGAPALIEFYQNGFEATGREELPRTKTEALEAAKRYPKDQQREMYEEYIGRISYSQKAKTTKSEEAAYDAGGMQNLEAVVKREDYMKQHNGSYDDYAKSIEQAGGLPALEQYAKDLDELAPYGLNTSSVHKMYTHAKNAYPQLGYDGFATAFKYVDSLGNDKGEGKNNKSISQAEICAAMTADPKRADIYYNLFWTSDKSIPVLKNGKYVSKQVRKR